ncbi:MAG: Fe(3+) ABC transporter substrate-binding protein [Alphaproteobacteria bacterium]|nr:Fe(3+) ABC transporter substrate-binding protein [Alphaproteobacteria bacterium]
MKSKKIIEALFITGLMFSSVSSVRAAETVSVYSARQEALIKPLLDAFTRETKIAVKLVTGGDDALLKRLESEGLNSPADLLISVDAGRLFRAKTMGVTQSFSSAAAKAAVPAQYRDPEGHWVGLSLRARPILYVKGKVDPATLSGYEDLADPKWKKKICIRSSDSIYNQSMVASLIVANGGEKTEAWARGLVANMALPPKGGDRDQIKAAAAGQCDIAVANTYYLVGMLTAKDRGQVEAAQKMGVFWPNQNGRGAHVNISGVALAKSAKNKDAAIKLVEFMLLPESQSWYAEANGEYPVRAGVDEGALLKSWGKFKADGVSLAKLGENNAAAVKLMDRAGWK